MNIKLSVAAVAGAFIGASTTFFTMKHAQSDLHHDELVQSLNVSASESPSESDPFTIHQDENESTEHPHGFTKMDMSDTGQRDLCVSLWYCDMSTLVDNLELHTGHKFKKQVGKNYASPVEILEEQAAFFQRFQEETQRISLGRDKK
jgi:hypothetical protein